MAKAGQIPPPWRNADEAVSVSVVDRILVVTLTRDLTGGVLDRLRTVVLARAQQARATGAVFDVTGLPLMDETEFHGLRQTGSMLRLLGTRPVLAGLQPTVVEVLSLLGAETSGFDATVANVQDALRVLQEPRRAGAKSR